MPESETMALLQLARRVQKVGGEGDRGYLGIWLRRKEVKIAHLLFRLEPGASLPRSMM
jgi:hypothetical protein